MTLSLPEVKLSSGTAIGFLIGAGIAIAILPLTLTGAVLMGAIVVVLTLLRVEYGIYLAIFSVPFGSIRVVSWGPAEVTATEFIVPLVFAAWLLKLVAQREAKIRFGPIFPFAVVFYCALVLSTTISVSQPLSAKELLKWGEFLLLYLVVLNVMKTRHQIAMVVVALLLATSAEALHGWYQFALRKGPEGFLIGERFLRAFGTFGQPNPYAAYLGLTLPVLLGLLIGAKWDMSLHVDWGFIALILGAAIIAAAMLMSMSRGAWLGLLVATGFMMAVRSRKSFTLLLAVIVTLTLIGLLGALDILPSQVTERLSVLTDYFGVFDVRQVILTPENWAIVERMAYWQSAWEMFKDHSVLGVGIGNFSAFYLDYAFPGWEVGASGHAHNYYLNLLAETGIIGLASYLALVLAVFLFALRSLRRLHGSHERSPKGWDWFSLPYPLVLGTTGAFVELTVHNFFDVLYVHSMAAQVGIVLGLIATIHYARPMEGD